ncbi:ATP-dependent DNA ligase [Isoptericola sp. NEAU-Y5]|uniref:Probable DNA ligase n=1 Tax=Isoptericola luteus TaxID=2879484 RepID=A0ABS7ZCQ0_9MICO|nr:ATP-dependent DNA ligase [Isoptericola sp. NEAU-Y5]MCA5892831.1 ATP-dependent DNA ligase [Isoptericola sp. NEAU-Y5]
MLLSEVVTTHAAVAATRSRLRKRELLAGALRSADPGDEVEVVAAFLSGRPRQRRTGLGWRTLARLPAPALEPSLSPLDVDEALSRFAAFAGAGSQTARLAAVAELFALATADEQDFVRRLVLGELRQGALDSLLLDAIAAAAEVPLARVRRAAMFSAYSGPIARAALAGGADALAAFRLEPGRPVRPMLASSAPDVAAALERFGGAQVAADTKLDGIRVQVHRTGDDVAVFTRSLDDITERLPEVVALARSLDVRAVVLDGEALLLDDAGRPRPFQDTAARTGTHETDGVTTMPLTVRFFDVLHHDGTDLIDAPTSERLAVLDDVVPPDAIVPRLFSADLDDLAEYFTATVAAGQEGLVIKALDAPYEAGRRGTAWVKVKPRHTLDLVVLAVEWGSGRRQGWLSNIWLGARDPASGDFVMLGKTFKGMTDEMLTWQTERFLGLETHREGHVVHVRPEQVVEIAFDGVQRSTRYPGGMALRFARVLRYRDDKPAAEADTLDTVRALGS